MAATILTTLIARYRHLCRPLVHSTDAELLQRFTQQRDVASFEELLQRHAALAWGVCRRLLRTEADCEDAFQATFLALVRQAGAIEARRSLAAWLHTVAVGVSHKTLRWHRLHPQALVPERGTPDDVVEDVGSRELLRIVDEEIERLPDVVRTPLILCCLQRQTRDEAAATLGCSVAAVKGRLQRGRELLRRQLELRGVQLPTAFLVLGLTGEAIYAGMCARTMQSVLAGPPPAVAALARAGLPLVTTARAKLGLAALLLVVSTVGVLGLALLTKPAQTPPTPLPQGNAAAAPKKLQAPQVRTDRHGDPLPEGAVARLGTVRWRHGAVVLGLAYSPDGKRIVTSGVGRDLVLWDVATGRELRAFHGRGQPGCVAFSPDGKVIATSVLAGQLWDASTGKMLRQLKDMQSRVNALAFAPDGKILATANSDGVVHLWDPTSRQ